jgi:hypothetical protein
VAQLEVLVGELLSVDGFTTSAITTGRRRKGAERRERDRGGGTYGEA